MFLLQTVEALAATSALVGFAAWWLMQAWQLHCFRRAVRTLSPYALHPDELPWSHEAVFLGRGYDWAARPTQRMALLGHADPDYTAGRAASSAAHRAPPS